MEENTILIPKIHDSIKEISKFPQEFEAETVVENLKYESELKKYFKINPDGVLSFVKAIQTIRKLSFLSDYRAFEAISIAISFKPVNFNEKDSEPLLIDCVKAYCILEGKTSEEIDKYMASKFIEYNCFMVPVEFIDIKVYIDQYLISAGRSDIIKRIIEFKNSDNKEFIDDQKEKLKDMYDLLGSDF